MRENVSKCVRAGRFFRPAHLFLAAALSAASIAAAPAPAAAQGWGDPLPAALKSTEAASREVRSFYASRGYRPLWFRNGHFSHEGDALLRLLDSAELDSVSTRRLKLDNLFSALRRSEDGSPKAIARAELLLSEAFATYVQAMRRTPGAQMRYASEALAPADPTKQAVLEAAADAPSLQRYVEDMGWMHPLYAPLRRSLARETHAYDAEQLVRLNLERIRAIPANPARRYVLVDAAAAKLYMYEDGRVRHTMNVVVGKADQQTPMMAGFLRYAIVNPYWNVPPDLVRTKVVPGVLKEGAAFLRKNRYEILSGWSDDARVLSHADVDWRAVASGRQELRVRQLPGASNSMGNVKFMFPNDLGIYLHDTPDKHLMKKANRQFSSGCVRLEDAAKLGTWLFGKPVKAPSAKPEQIVNMPEPVPVYITYLTAVPEGERIAFRQDVYGRDGTALAMAGARAGGAR